MISLSLLTTISLISHSSCWILWLQPNTSSFSWEFAVSNSLQCCYLDFIQAVGTVEDQRWNSLVLLYQCSFFSIRIQDLSFQIQVLCLYWVYFRVDFQCQKRDFQQVDWLFVDCRESLSFQSQVSFSLRWVLRSLHFEFSLQFQLVREFSCFYSLVLKGSSTLAGTGLDSSLKFSCPSLTISLSNSNTLPINLLISSSFFPSSGTLWFSISKVNILCCNSSTLVSRCLLVLISSFFTRSNFSAPSTLVEYTICSYFSIIAFSQSWESFSICFRWVIQLARMMEWSRWGCQGWGEVVAESWRRSYQLFFLRRVVYFLKDSQVLFISISLFLLSIFSASSLSTLPFRTSLSSTTLSISLILSLCFMILDSMQNNPFLTSITLSY